MLGAWHNIYARSDDSAQPIKISADKVDVNQKNNITRYTGNVKLTQGTLHIDADEVVVHYRAGNVETVSAIGTPVTLHHLNKQSEDIFASAARLQYYASEKKVDLFDQVAVRRGKDELHGDVAHYDIEKEELTAQGENPQSRVYTVIQPAHKAQQPLSEKDKP